MTTQSIAAPTQSSLSVNYHNYAGEDCPPGSPEGCGAGGRRLQEGERVVVVDYAVRVSTLAESASIRALTN